MSTQSGLVYAHSQPELPRDTWEPLPIHLAAVAASAHAFAEPFGAGQARPGRGDAARHRQGFGGLSALYQRQRTKPRPQHRRRGGGGALRPGLGPTDCARGRGTPCRSARRGRGVRRAAGEGPARLCRVGGTGAWPAGAGGNEARAQHGARLQPRLSRPHDLLLLGRCGFPGDRALLRRAGPRRPHAAVGAARPP